ncbi:predicted protein [Streptomyces viridochromogenes DSM 40736]|uniref:Predicted protein n=1 Tax=Streptomyces viridochromogenes (strain DSM 40736 / JCM 4977 / BCRC 1201 / Tue 494) TaxID=591159 RepID=D9WXP3_STRVT|nr:hypothetical protein [Streptomyces viridochromogenes]EFL33088.1 predicted protein [Streptomyces viridochromogenes DSM 40736]
MHDLIPRALEWLRLLFAPGTGKRRRCLRCSPHLRLTPVRPVSQPEPSHLPRHRSPYGLPTHLDGTASALVRPYLAAHEALVGDQKAAA